MKTFKSASGTFSLIDFASNGAVKAARSAGFTDANSINVSSVYIVSGASSSGFYISNLPNTSYGFLITLAQNSANFLQIYLCLSASMAGNGVMFLRKTTSGTPTDWYHLPALEVVSV